MSWEIIYIEAAKDDFQKLDHTQQVLVLKAIQKVAKNPLPAAEGGYGKPLGNRVGKKLSGYFKIKLLKVGIRVVYTIIREKYIMKIIVISIRDDNQVYKIADSRIK